jgi:hypothetical protein
MIKGSFDINIEQIRQDMTVTFPAINNFREYGPVIKNACDGMTTYRLAPAASRKIEKRSNEEGNMVKEFSRMRRSATDEEQRRENNYQEFAGKYIQYNILNLNEIE